MRAFTWLIQRFDKENRHIDRRGESETMAGRELVLPIRKHIEPIA